MIRKAAVYSSSRRQAAPPAPQAAAAPAPKKRRSRWRRLRFPVAILGLALVLGATLALLPRGMMPDEVDAAIKGAIEAIPPKPAAADAYEKIRPSVVLVSAHSDEGETDPARGTGVIMVESGIILTNLIQDRKSTRLNSSHLARSRMPSSA